MVTRETRAAVDLVVDVTGRSISDVLREVVDVGLPPVARRVKRSRRLLAEALEEVQGARESEAAESAA